MASEFSVQLALLILTLAVFFAVLKLPKQALTKLRSKNRATVQSSRHAAEASRLLDQARSSPHTAQTLAHAKSALAEAEKALALFPRYPAAHILKALALDLMERRSSALRSLDVALSPPCVKSLSGRERGEALLKRAELKLAMNRRRRVDSAVEDLEEVVRLGGAELEALCLLGQCYEWKGMREEAREVYEKAFRVEPGSFVARQGLDRLGS